MGAPDHKPEWVVLINKVPKGPLTKQEVEALISQGILRRNDVAYRIGTAHTGAEQHEWKILWQYEEFNRRRGLEPTTIVEQPDCERRTEAEPETLRAQALSELPPDLLDITVEDLLPKTTSVNVSPEPRSIEQISLTDSRTETAYIPGERTVLRLAGLVGAILVLSFGGVKLTLRPPSSSTVQPTDTTERVPATTNSSGQIASARLVRPRPATTSVSKTAEPLAAPSKRDDQLYQPRAKPVPAERDEQEVEESGDGRPDSAGDAVQSGASETDRNDASVQRTRRNSRGREERRRDRVRERRVTPERDDAELYDDQRSDRIERETDSMYYDDSEPEYDMEGQSDDSSAGGLSPVPEDDPMPPQDELY